jgi:hypothetical protein
MAESKTRNNKRRLQNEKRIKSKTGGWLERGRIRNSRVAQQGSNSKSVERPQSKSGE